MEQGADIISLEREVTFLRSKVATLDLELKLMKEQMNHAVRLAAEGKNAINIASDARAMASEALIVANTGRNLDEMMGEPSPSQKADIVQFNSREAYLSKLAED